MRGTKAGVVTVLAIATSAACGSGAGTGSSALSALARFAEGEWACELTSAEMPEDVGLHIDATVEAETSTRGTFSFQIEGLDATRRPENEGEWRLDGGSLQMDVSDISSYVAEGVDLDTERIEILEDAPGSELQRVDVERDGDESVTFSWADPWTGADTQMACTKR